MKKTKIERRYDEFGNEIYYKSSEGVEEWREYDESGNETYYKDSEGNKWAKDKKLTS